MEPIHRSWLWRRLEDPDRIVEALRSATYRDRAPLEKALSRYFFAPFSHQEVVEGEAFERRARVSRIALGLDEDRVREVADDAVAQVAPGTVEDLLEEVRARAVAAMVRLTFGDDALEEVTRDAVRDFDDRIKMRGPSDPRCGLALRDPLAERLADPSAWPERTLLGQAREAWAACSLRERVDHVASVILGTGSIQVTDVVTHSLIALHQHPAARRFDDEAILRETLRRYPVNASVTRRPRGEGWRGGISVVPERVNQLGWTQPEVFDPGRFAREDGFRFGFGHGPRACPARRFALVLTTRLLAGYRALGVAIEPKYRHRRSLAVPVRASLGGAPAPARPSMRTRLRHHVGYARRCLTTYPRVLWEEVLQPALDQGGKEPPHSWPHCPKMQLIDCNAKSAADKSPLKQFNTQIRSGLGPPRQF